MPTRAEVEALRRAQAELARRADADLTGYFESLDLERPERARDGLLVVVPVIVATYGAASSTVAADWYDAVRADARVGGRFRARMAPTFPAEFVQARVRFGAGHLFTSSPGQMLPFLSGAVDEYVKQAGRDTVVLSSTSDPKASGWVRVTRGAQTCDMCTFLAARGAVYRSEFNAAFATHGHCDCEAVPSWDADAPAVPARVYRPSQRTRRMSDEQRRVHNERLRDGIDRWKAEQAT